MAALLVVFYMFYRLLLERTSLVHFNRVVLLLTAVLSFVLPLCIITVHEYVEAIPVTATTVETAGNEILQQAPVSFWSEYGPRLTLLLTVVLVGGMFIRTGIVVKSFLNLNKLISNSEKQTLADGVVMAITDEPVAPFSWMRTVVMNRSDYASQTDGGAILAHERGHIRCHHSLDVVLVEVLTALQWFNPVVWFLRQDLRALHECEADQAVLSQGFNTDQYIQLLIRKAIGLPVSQLANGMSARTIKKRIVMMKTNRKPSRSSWLRALYILPIVALALIVQAHTVVECRQPSLATEGVANDSLLVAIDGGACYTSLDELPKIVKPEDIGSITVVKGKAAVDVFGEERAKDGVVVIETKAYKQQLEQTPPDTVVFNGERDALANAYAIHLKDLTQIGEVLKGKVASAPELDYEGGFNAFLANNLKYPVDALKYGVTDKMTIAFRVNEDGTTTLPHLVTGSIKGEVEYTGAVVYGYKNPNMQKPNAEQQKAAEAALFEEVQRVLKKAPKWKPARNGEGEPMAVTVSFPVIFQ
ncbi:MAG: hypothetical protein IJK43_07615 [Prevotella sp.]|nr:hypothetical protein [Prevotella sp.]